MAEQSNGEDVRPGRKRVWRWVRRTGYLLLALAVLAPVGAFVIVNRAVGAPNPAEISARQQKVVTLLYADGSVMTRIASAGGNREPITGRIPDAVRHAVLAAEQPDFDTAADFDLGSGIGKKYLRLVTENADTSWSRRFTEVVLSHKLSSSYSKDLILTAYLDTVYLGRTAFGFATAARAYYGKELAQLTPSEAAAIAGLIPNPARSEDTAYASSRWASVMDVMAEQGWITREYRSAQAFPKPLPISQTQLQPLEGVRAHIRKQVERELEAAGFPPDRAAASGVVVRTTIDPKAQQAAESAVTEVMTGQPNALRQALTAIDPAKGAVRAYWAGKDGTGVDYALDTLQEPGTTFLPFALTAALQKGTGLDKTFDGTSPRKFDGQEVHNHRDSQACGRFCSLRSAAELDVATAYYDLVLNETGTLPVATAAKAAGIPASVQIDNVRRDLLVADGGGAPDATIAIGGGKTVIRPFDLAVAYATFAAEGVHHEPYFVERIESVGGQVLYQHSDSARSAFAADAAQSKAIAGTVTSVLRSVPALVGVACAAGRECAGKPGTQPMPNSTTDVSKAWMVGYTPTLAAAVWTGTDSGTVKIVNAAGEPVEGAGLPGDIWRRFMDKALDGTPLLAFPEVAPIG